MTNGPIPPDTPIWAVAIVGAIIPLGIFFLSVIAAHIYALFHLEDYS